MHPKIKPVILSGGSGTRLWPLSRTAYPKQFLSFTGQHSLLQNTASRLINTHIEAPTIICNDEHRFIVAEQLRALNIQPNKIILEPVGRNTAPAATIAALLTQHEPDTVIALFPADHTIQEQPEVFAELVQQAATLANQGHIVTLGIAPHIPHTGFGYIQKGVPIKVDFAAFTVALFTEKPDFATAKNYLNSQQFLWNSGIFFFRADTLLNEIQQHQPAIFTACQHALKHAAHDLHFLRLDQEHFTQAPNISLDYAVMEKTNKAAVIPAKLVWNDLGSWQAVWDHGDKDAQGNFNQGDVLSIETENCYLQSNTRLLATAGIKDLVVIETADAVLVTSRHSNENLIKQLVGQLETQQRKEGREHLCQYRPWGYFRTLELGDNFQVKLLHIKPGGRLSLQLHHHRAEHWVVVSGTAKVSCGDETKLLTANQSTYIPLGVKHRIENPGEVPLQVIEVQSGTYLGEDDIVRFEDDYARHHTTKAI